MKTRLLFIIFLLTINTVCFSQNNWNNYSNHDDSFEISIHQDTKFVFTGDDLGNHAGTIDIIIKVEIPLIKFSRSHVLIFPSYEYAGLHGGAYRRYSVGVGYVYKDIYFKNLNAGIFPDIGRIFRFNKIVPSFGLGLEVSYRLTKRFSLSYLHQILERTDLKLMYNEEDFIRHSSFIGFKIHL